MAALDFEPRQRSGLLKTVGLGRLLVLVAVACAVLGLVWLVQPERLGPATRPALALPGPLRPIPASLPALSPEAETILGTVRDGDAVRDLPYYFLLREARAARAAAAAPPSAIDVEPEDLMAHPAVFRGRVVRMAGVFLREYPVELPENLSGIQRVTTGEMGSRGGTLVTFVVPQEEPIDGRFGEDLVLTGYFLQVRRFVSREGAPQEGPLMILTSVQRTPARERPPVIWIVGFAAGGVLLVGGVAALTLARQRRCRARRAGVLGRRP